MKRGKKFVSAEFFIVLAFLVIFTGLVFMDNITGAGTVGLPEEPVENIGVPEEVVEDILELPVEEPVVEEPVEEFPVEEVPVEEEILEEIPMDQDYLGEELIEDDESETIEIGNIGIQATCGGATNCSCGDTVNESYNLGGDLSCVTNGLVIGANNIYIDCQGNSITNSLNMGYGIYNSGYDNVTVKNCNISNFQYGIRYESGADDGLINNNTFSYSSPSISIHNSDRNLISNNTLVTPYNGLGIYIVTFSENNVIDNNNISVEGAAEGIRVLSSANYNNVTNNYIVTNGTQAYGINPNSVEFNIFRNNTVITNGTNAHAFNIEHNSDNNVFVDNTIFTYGSGSGYYASGGENNQMINNTIITYGAEGYGINLYSAINYTFSGNKINTSKANSILIGGSTLWYLDPPTFYNHSITTDNLVEGLPVLYNLSVTDLTIFEDVDLSNIYGTILCVLCDNVTYNNVTMAKDGINLLNSSNSRISNSVLTTSTGYAVWLEHAENIVLVNNTINASGNSLEGVNLKNTNGANLTANEINTSGVGSSGINLNDYSVSNIISNNTIITHSDESYGVYFDYSPQRNVFINNSIEIIGNSSYGLYLDTEIHAGSTNSHNFTSNSFRITGNNSVGVYLGGYSNNFISNRFNVGGDFGYGFFLNETCRNNNLENNNITITNGYSIYDPTGDSYTNYLIYNNSHGEIKWINDSNGGFLKNLTLNNSIGLDINLIIGNNTISLNTSAFGANLRINSSANITMYGLTFAGINAIYKYANYSDNTTEIIENGINCLGSDCVLNGYGVGVLYFNSTSLSSFAVNGTDASQNTPPNASQVIVNATSIYNATTDDLNCWVLGEDAGQTLLRADWTWYNNSQQHSNGSMLINNGSLTNVATLSSSNTAFGNNWTCAAQIYDGFNVSNLKNDTISIRQYKCGDYITSTTTLLHDITNCSGTNLWGLRILTDDIVLDCNNYSITGAGYSISGWGVRIEADNVTLRNCNITDFGLGIYLGRSDCEITNNTISDSSTGIYITGNSNLIQNNEIFNNLKGLNLYSSSYNDVIENNLYNNTVGYEFQRYANSNNIFSNNVANSTYGVLVNNSYSGTGIVRNIFKDIEFEDNDYDLFLFQGDQANLTFINSSINKSKLYVYVGGVAYFKWYVDVNVTDTSGNPLENVSISAINSINGTEDTGLTNSNGIARLNVTELYRNDNINYYVTPGTILASKNNYTQNTSQLNIINKTYALLNITLDIVPCGGNITTDFTLGNDYLCMNGFTVTEDGVTIDGNGYNLIGFNSSTGIDLDGRDNINIVDLKIKNFTTGINFFGTNNSNLSGLTLENNYWGIIFNNSNENEVYNSAISDNYNYGVLSVNQGETNNSLINVNIDLSNISVSGTANILKKWYVDINATYNQGNPLSNAKGIGYFTSTGTVDDSGLTDDDGEVRLELTELKKNTSGIFYLTPHNVSISFASALGNKTNSTIVNLTQTNNTQVNLGITLNCTVPVAGMLLGSNTTFCPGTYTADNIYINADNIVVNCVDTTFYFGGTIRTNGKNNIQINDCIFDGRPGISIEGGENITVNNVRIERTGSGYSISASGKGIVINNSAIGSRTYGIRMSSCNDTLIVGNNFTEDFGIRVDGCINCTFRNNIFDGVETGIRFGRIGSYGNLYGPSNQSKVYHNNFSGVTLYNIEYNVNDSLYENFFNTTVNVSGTLVSQGNTYSDYCNKGADNNLDGYADARSSPTVNDWPYSENITDKINDPNIGNGGVIDWAPKKIACPPTEVFLGGGGGGGGPTTAAAGEVTPAPSTSERRAILDETDPNKIAENVKRTSEVEKVGKKTKWTVGLENTGDKRIKLLRSISQEIDEPFFIVTTKTLGFKGSLLGRLANIVLSEDPVDGRLLSAEVKLPEGTEEIVLDPGERLDLDLEITEGLVFPREIKIQFNALGETVFEEELKREEVEAISGTAIDVERGKNLLDVYAVIVPAEYYGAGQVETTQDFVGTGGAVADITPENDQYWIELNINPKEGMFAERKALPAKLNLAKKVGDMVTGRKTYYSDLYGPYELKEEQAFIFAQQFEYDPEAYSGEYYLRTKIFRGEELVVENEFEVMLGEEVAGEEIEVVKDVTGERKNLIGEAIGKVDTGKVKIWILPVFTVVLVLIGLLYMFVVRVAERKRLKGKIYNSQKNNLDR